MIRIKICGITSHEDARAAVDAGADALGFIFVNGTPRYVEPEAAAAIIVRMPPFVATVGVFVDRTPEEIELIVRTCGLSLAQLHGHESPDACCRLGAPFIKTIHVQGEDDLEALHSYPQAKAFVLDTYVAGQPGGTGRTFPWEIAAKAARQTRIILSGGLTPDNVALAVTQVRPYALDVSSGVEASPGRKDHHKVREFIEQARKADAR
ncbi:MAG: phosphoribosylanthranilate isomerase [Candidatus Methylomirabilis oxygeniifera]|uniref:N-(5'-phosphoribosyl)anthranilate isomerase n=1 Tax=Methylomirabilis oxygeniifera TaxID=671143 RepID=D5MFE4_METO1|nr:MAG: phosphoribosylanthranilate isomerase [Candidatus Methylomirabilis oxyfera]CBE68475.1 N-(5'-phosphoribosyl)anthranilate isomerase (PRAI) [Candidatus Methylomirabilis oxyfera]